MGAQLWASSYFFPQTLLLSILPLSHPPGPSGTRLSPSRGGPFTSLFRAGSSLPILHIPVPHSRLDHSSLAVSARNNPTEVGEVTSLSMSWAGH